MFEPVIQLLAQLRFKRRVDWSVALINGGSGFGIDRVFDQIGCSELPVKGEGMEIFK